MGHTVESLQARAIPDSLSGCLRWSGAKNTNGYGRVHVAGRRSAALVHRLIVELHTGKPIPEGHVVDHVQARGCVHVDCINLDHLEVVTQQENMLRGGHPRAVVARTGVCVNGHRLEGANVSVENGRPRCRRCVNERKRAARMAA